MTVEFKIADQDKQEELVNFLALVNGEYYRGLARKYVDCMYSDDFRRPTFFIGVQNDVIIGAAAFSEELFTVNMWGISWVSVHPDFRHQGIGQSLVQYCLDTIKEYVDCPVTCVLATYPDKTKLYEKIGFKTSSYDAQGGTIMTLVLQV